MPGDMVEVLAEKVVAAGQSLLRTVAELKRRALLADAAAVNSAVDERSERCGQAAGATEAALRALRDEVSSSVQARSLCVYESECFLVSACIALAAWQGAVWKHMSSAASFEGVKRMVSSHCQRGLPLSCHCPSLAWLLCFCRPNQAQRTSFSTFCAGAGGALLLVQAQAAAGHRRC